MEDYRKCLEDIIVYIQSSSSYKKSLSLKEKMSNNSLLMSKINEIKKLQKSYIRSNYDSNIKEQLDLLNKELSEIPLFSIYLESLEDVNMMIDFVRDSLNDYFDKLLN